MVHSLVLLPHFSPSTHLIHRQILIEIYDRCIGFLGLCFLVIIGSSVSSASFTDCLLPV